MLNAIVKWLARTTVVALFGLVSIQAAVSAEDTLRIVDWGGAGQKANSDAWYKPYADKSGIKVVEDTWNGELGKIKSMVETGNVTWDVINGDVEHAIAGCDEGFLEKIDVKELGGADKFLPGTVYECGVPTHLFSVIFGYNENKVPAAWGSGRPTTIADMFDAAKWPGKRALRKDPKWLLEPVLMADGVAPEDVYKVLGEPGGVERALKKLETIKKDVIWWTSGAQGPQLLADGEVALAQLFANRLYIANSAEGQKFVAIWDGQVYAPNSWIIPKGANKEGAMKFLQYVTQPEIVSQVSHQHSTVGLAIIGADKYVPAEILDYVPTSPKNMTKALASGEAWWADHYDEVNATFQKWLAQ